MCHRDRVSCWHGRTLGPIYTLYMGPKLDAIKLNSKAIFSFAEKLSYTQAAVLSAGLGGCKDSSLPWIYVRLNDPEIFNFINASLHGGHSPN